MKKEKKIIKYEENIKNMNRRSGGTVYLFFKKKGNK